MHDYFKQRRRKTCEGKFVLCRPTFWSKQIIDLFGILVNQVSFHSYYSYVFFGSPFLNYAAITCLYVTDSDASLVFHIQSRIKSKEFKWVISPNMYRNEYIYICLHRHTQISMNFFSWVGGGLRCYMWGCIKKNILVGPCAVFQSWFSVCSMCLSASILGISGRIEHTPIYVSQDIQNEPRSGVWLLCVAWNYDVL